MATEHDPKLVEDLGKVIHEDHWWDCDHYGGEDCAEDRARAVLDKLTGSGRLLPPGGEVSTQYAVHATGKDGRRMPGLVVHHSLAAAQKWKARLEADRSIGKVTLTIHQRQAHIWEDGWEHYTPWSPVLSDNSEGESSG